ncbi:sensor histidine kinase [Novosphingobium sp. RD2P27]|uniref:histidine kinase n=1 Tax=Novosphingobium kalidii TaxID=3230299 RepID=A0ABV2D2W7_9SPHN
MDGPETILARAVSDPDDRLVTADELLTGLQRRCGGELPGTIAVPELLELVSKARRYRNRLARTICAHDGADVINAWVEVTPKNDGSGCEIVLRSWRATPLPPEDNDGSIERRAVVDRQVAELVAWLDAEQRILAVASDSAELRDLATAMQEGIGRPFTDVVNFESGAAHPLHWRLLDGAPIRIPGSSREWRIVLLPQAQPGAEPAGFELLLVSDEPYSEPEAPALAGMGLGRGLVGQDLAPVLRQPISRIIANAETIRTRLAGPLPDAYADYAGEIANAGRLLLGLLEDLSDLEIVESSTFVAAPDHIDLAEVARQAAGILGVRAREKCIVIEGLSPAESLPAVAEFRRVLQIFINLIGNAIRYSPEGSHVSIRLEHRDERARVIVADEGPGLSEEEQAIVFEKFERLGRSGDGGSGLGLYISRRLARAMNGELSVESQKGQGARFILDMPVDPEAVG